VRVLFVCGGTAGHIYPAVSVADRLRERFPEGQFLFVGVEGAMETRLVPREGYEIETLKVSGLRRSVKPKDLVHNVKTVWHSQTARLKAKRILRRFQPDVVLGTGGYVCYPVIRAAHSLGIPTLIHESNALPGLTTRMLERYTDRVLVGFEESREHYKQPEKIIVTGTPVRRGFTTLSKGEARRALGYTDTRPLLLSFWGSLGASKMNELTAGLMARNEAEGCFRQVHASGGGEKEEARMRGLLADRGVKTLVYTDLRPFIYDMPTLMAAADLVLCRAGASTVAELCATGTPCLLVPSPNVTNNHQEKNARVLEARGGALLLTEAECTEQRLYELLRDTVTDPAKIASMSAAMLKLGRPEAVENIVETMLSLVKA
jgi:UDP-N-acetylglucosamine--N-acetylmuramyl-(pentapeptide) pyrophosphoryl-undecaprenol N-acetylglucosamine transferase